MPDTQRRYTVKEIDDLRDAHRQKLIWGRYSGTSGIDRPEGGSWSSRTYREDEIQAQVEERVRTSMLAGHTAKDLKASDGADDWIGTSRYIPSPGESMRIFYESEAPEADG